MAIPDNINSKHLLAAIERIKKEGIPADGASKYYDVLDKEGNRYPPKLVVSYANFFSNGYDLDRNTFSGGMDTPAFRLLDRAGLTIVRKNEETFYDQLILFLGQAKNSLAGNPDHETGHYRKRYKDLNVHVSIGRVQPGSISWIAFLDHENKVQKGIYPLFLFYPAYDLLILTYGVSDIYPPDQNWDLEQPLTIAEYFAEQAYDEPTVYDHSFVFKTYDTRNGIDRYTMNKDLNEIIDFYKHRKKQQAMTRPQAFAALSLHELFASFEAANYRIGNDVTTRFVASLITKPFVILTGLSGSGKTKLAEAFAHWICKNENQYTIIPVGADWTNRDPLLGFPDALNKGHYIKPDNRALDLLIEANKTENADLPYFIILDEMNLSHVERYFADFLSVIETQGDIHLHSEKNNWGDVPPHIKWPDNLFLVGTVNIDETTYMFSPKVLDRANVIEFRVTEDEMRQYLADARKIDMEQLSGKGARMAPALLQTAADDTLTFGDREALNDELLRFFAELKKIGAEFGYRTAFEISRFAAVFRKLDPSAGTKKIIDAAIVQKLLPKVHGSRRKLEAVLLKLAGLCMDDAALPEDMLREAPLRPAGLEVRYPVALDKIRRMYHNAVANGFTSFAEA